MCSFIANDLVSDTLKQWVGFGIFEYYSQETNTCNSRMVNPCSIVGLINVGPLYNVVFRRNEDGHWRTHKLVTPITGDRYNACRGKYLEVLTNLYHRHKLNESGSEAYLKSQKKYRKCANGDVIFPCLQSRIQVDKNRKKYEILFQCVEKCDAAVGQKRMDYSHDQIEMYFATYLTQI